MLHTRYVDQIEKLNSINKIKNALLLGFHLCIESIINNKITAMYPQHYKIVAITLFYEEILLDIKER